MPTTLKVCTIQIAFFHLRINDTDYITASSRVGHLTHINCEFCGSGLGIPHCCFRPHIFPLIYTYIFKKFFETFQNFLRLQTNFFPKKFFSHVLIYFSGNICLIYTKNFLQTLFSHTNLSK